MINYATVVYILPTQNSYNHTPVKKRTYYKGFYIPPANQVSRYFCFALSFTRTLTHHFWTNLVSPPSVMSWITTYVCTNVYHVWGYQLALSCSPGLAVLSPKGKHIPRGLMFIMRPDPTPHIYSAGTPTSWKEHGPQWLNIVLGRSYMYSII